MKRLACGLGLLALLAVAALAPRPADADDANPTLKEIMQKLHKGANSPLAQLKKELKDKPSSWKAVQDQTKDFVILGAALTKTEPPKGDKASYKAMADSYFADSKAMDDAAKKEDLAATRTAFNKVSGSCMSCHRAHRK